jgi:ABC-type lipoprotein export system ATPase subunit
LVADEPTGSLDSVTADHIFELFQNLVDTQEMTIIMVTHDMSLAPRFSRTLQITDGELDSHHERSEAETKDVSTTAQTPRPRSARGESK